MLFNDEALTISRAKEMPTKKAGESARLPMRLDGGFYPALTFIAKP
jgi:hypothetical protein